MNIRALLLLCTSYTIAYADTWELPPVIDNSGYPPQTATLNANTANTAAPSNSAVYEMMGRLEQLQKEVQQLTGKVEEQAYLIGELKRQQKVMYADFDDRLQSIENKESNASDAAATPPAADDNSVSTEQTTVAVTETPAPANTAETVVPKKPALPSPTAKPTPPPVPVEEKHAYDTALTALRTGHTSQAIEAFSAYLQKYPASNYYADNARLYLGEAYRLNHNNEAARKAFNSLITQQPKSDKVPDALLMLGIIELEQKNNDKARDYFTRVRKEFPHSTAAQRAAKKLDVLQ